MISVPMVQVGVWRGLVEAQVGVWRGLVEAQVSVWRGLIEARHGDVGLVTPT